MFNIMPDPFNTCTSMPGFYGTSKSNIFKVAVIDVQIKNLISIKSSFPVHFKESKFKGQRDGLIAIFKLLLYP